MRFYALDCARFAFSKILCVGKVLSTVLELNSFSFKDNTVLGALLCECAVRLYVTIPLYLSNARGEFHKLSLKPTMETKNLNSKMGEITESVPDSRHSYSGHFEKWS